MRPRTVLPILSCLGICILILGAPGAIRADTISVEFLERVSGFSPFAGCTADSVPFPGGVFFLHSEVEPWVAVNPVDPLNIVATWQQDRWSNGGARGLVVGVSFDGGIDWELMPIPGLTRCSGGPWFRASDPWLSFAPNGDLYHIALAFSFGTNAMLVSKSTDGGRSWGAPVELIRGSAALFNDKESITADPTDSNFVYAVWDRFDFTRPGAPALFARSIDGGATWEPARIIHDPGTNNQTVAHQIVVLPDGTVVDFFSELFNITGSNTTVFISLKRSVDKGSTWLPRFSSKRVRRMVPVAAVDRERGIPVRDGAFLFDVGVDPVRGSLFAVWQDGRFSGSQYPDIAFSRSTDGGITWSPPVAVNRTPTDIPASNRQAFLPSVHVADNGTVGISYYDFRFNGPGAGTLTDHFFISCHPQARDCANPVRWDEEVRLTDESFDIGAAPFANGLFLGDYVGLTAAGDDFFALFTQPHEGDPSSAFGRRIVFEETVDPLPVGYWKHQIRANLTGHGRMDLTEAELLELLADLHVLYGLFDDLAGLDGLGSVLLPIPSPSMRERAFRHFLALALNVTSGRLSPYVEIGPGETVAEAISAIAAVLENPDSADREMEQAKDLAEAINEGRLPVR